MTLIISFLSYLIFYRFYVRLVCLVHTGVINVALFDLLEHNITCTGAELSCFYEYNLFKVKQNIDPGLCIKMYIEDINNDVLLYIYVN